MRLLQSFSQKGGGLWQKKMVLRNHYHPLYMNNETEVWDLQNQKRFQPEFQVHFIANIGQNNMSRTLSRTFCWQILKSSRGSIRDNLIGSVIRASICI